MQTNRLLLFAAWFFLASGFGCASSGLLPGKIAGLSKPAAERADVPTAAQGELPPKEKAKACMVAAEELQGHGHLQQATLLYERARASDPSLKSVSHRLAVLYDAQGNSTQSLIEYNKAVECDPKNANLLSDLGYYHYERGNQSEAEQCLRKALEIDPKHQKALSNLGLVFAEQGRFEESFAAFSKVVGPAAAHSNLGVLMAKQGRDDLAMQAFHQALAIDPTLEQARAFLKCLEDRRQTGGPPQFSACLAPSTGTDRL